MFDHGDMIFYSDEHGFGEGSLGSAPAYGGGSNSESMHAYSAEKRRAHVIHQSEIRSYVPTLETSTA